MRSVLGQAQERALVRSMPEAMTPNGSAPTVKEIPYDYVATFILQGRRGHRVQDVINISVDGAFVAVAIGYSFIPELPKHIRIQLPPDSSGPIELASSTTGTVALTTGPIWRLITGGDLQQPPSTLEGLNVEFLLAATSPSQTQESEPLVNPVALLQCLLMRTCGIDFKYSIIDSGTGRELQNQPIHNIAGLGESSGERPFRPPAKPVLFMPRSTIRIEVEELSEGLLYKDAQLYIVLHGYKILGYGTGLP
jgi:hypothetical protein